MSYAVVQTSLTPPSKEALRAAFDRVPELTAADAHIVGDDAFGILVSNFNESSARALQSALSSQGVDTVVLPQSDLPAMPPRKIIRRLNFHPDGLEFFDPIGRPITIDWGHIDLIAAGSVKDIRPSTETQERKIRRYSGVGRYQVSYDETKRDYYSKESREPRFRLDIVLGDGVQALSADFGQRADLLFGYLGERRVSNQIENFTMLIQDLTRHAPDTAVNRGAFQLRENRGHTQFYPSRNAFHEEIIWLLWRLRARRR